VQWRGGVPEVRIGNDVRCAIVQRVDANKHEDV
jgi:hypothetical protein